MEALGETLGSVDPVVQWMARLALGLLFAAAAAHKVRDRDGFRAALSDYALLPASAISAFAATLALAEALVALGLLLPLDRLMGTFAPSGAAVLAGLGALGLLSIYSGALLLSLLRGRRDIDCGCAGFGIRESTQTSIGWGLVVRNVVLIFIACLSVASLQSRDLFWLDGFVIAMGAGFFVLLYAAIERAMQNATLEAR